MIIMIVICCNIEDALINEGDHVGWDHKFGVPMDMYPSISSITLNVCIPLYCYYCTELNVYLYNYIDRY